jgi:hypothetical protein
MSHNRKVLKTATKELGKAKAPAKPKDKLFSMPVVSTEGYKQGPPPSGSHYRIPGNGQSTSIYNPTPYPLDLVGPNGTHAQIGPWDTNTQNFNEPYMDEFPQGENDVDYEDELDEEQIAELRAGGYTVEDISVPSVGNYKQGGSLLTKKVACKKCGWKWDAADGGDDVTTCHKCGGEGLIHAQTGFSSPYYSYGDKKYMKKGNDWLVDYNGKYVPLSKNVAARSTELNKNAKYVPAKTLEKSPYQLQQEAKLKSGQSNYDMMASNKPQVADNTKVVKNKIASLSELAAAEAIKKQFVETEKKIKNDFNNTTQYYEDYHKSPMYKSMLNNSMRDWGWAKEDPSNISEGRSQNLKSLESPTVLKVQPTGEDESTGGWSSSSTGNITVTPLGYKVQGILPHEISHSIDRPLHRWSDRLIPTKDIAAINKFKPKNFITSLEFQNLSSSDQKMILNNPEDEQVKEYVKNKEEWNDYVGNPTETRARLNDIRMQSKFKGVYDPFTQKVSPDIYKKLLNTPFEKNENEGFDALKQLKGVYTDKQIQWMLNNISKNQEQNQENIEQGVARKGGSLKKYSRSIEAQNKLFRESLLLKKKKSKKKKIFDPSSSYFQDSGFLPQAQFGANVDENGKPIYYTEEEYRHMSEANQRGDEGTESNPTVTDEVTVKAQGPDWARYEKEYLSKQSRDQFIADKKREYIKRNKNFNRLAGVTMDNFDPRVESEFGKNFDYNKNSYITRRLGKQDHFNPKRRGEWIDELTPTERKIVADSKYGNKLQANLWDRSLAGLQELGNAAIKTGTFGIVNKDVLKNRISGLTKKEQAEIANSNTGALSTFDFANIPGSWAANYLKNRNLSTGSDYKVLPGWSSGELMPNVDQTDAMAMNPLTYIGMGEAMAGKSLLGLGANQLKQFGKTAPGLMKEVPTIVKSVADASYMGMRPRKLYSPLNLKFLNYGKKVEGNITPLGNVLKRTIHNDAIGEPISWGNRTWSSVTGKPIAQNLLKERPGATNKIFSMQVNPTIAGSNISKGATEIPNRLKTLNWNPTTELNYMGKPATSIPLNDAGVSLYRRLPFSNRYASIDPQKLMNNKFQWSTAGSGAQNLAEKYASVAGTMGGIGLGGLGYEALKDGENPISRYNTVNPLTGNKLGYETMTLGYPSFEKFVSEPNPYFIRDIGQGTGLIEKADGGSIEMDVDDDMIQYLLSQGYDVEDIY